MEVEGNGMLKENKEKENIDAALVCEDRLREYTWTINEEQAQVVDAVLVFQTCGSFEVWPQGTREPSTGKC